MQDDNNLTSFAWKSPPIKLLEIEREVQDFQPTTFSKFQFFSFGSSFQYVFIKYMQKFDKNIPDYFRNIYWNLSVPFTLIVDILLWSCKIRKLPMTPIPFN